MYMYVYIYILYTCIYICIYVWVYMCIHMFIYTYVYNCIYRYICTYNNYYYCMIAIRVFPDLIQKLWPAVHCWQRIPDETHPKYRRSQSTKPSHGKFFRNDASCLACGAYKPSQCFHPHSHDGSDEIQKISRVPCNKNLQIFPQGFTQTLPVVGRKSHPKPLGEKTHPSLAADKKVLIYSMPMVVPRVCAKMAHLVRWLA